MKRIELTKGMVALVDDEDFGYLSRWRWKYHKDGYAVRGSTGGGNVYMHRVINKTPQSLLTDHINRDGLDNRRCNLRTVNHSQNSFNTGNFKTNTSGVKGVTWNKARRKWQAQINVKRRCIYLGLFKDKAKAFDARLTAEVTYAKI